MQYTAMLIVRYCKTKHNNPKHNIGVKLSIATQVFIFQEKVLFHVFLFSEPQQSIIIKYQYCKNMCAKSALRSTLYPVACALNGQTLNKAYKHLLQLPALVWPVNEPIRKMANEQM